jgi:hypothetical protein
MKKALLLAILMGVLACSPLAAQESAVAAPAHPDPYKDSRLAFAQIFLSGVAQFDRMEVTSDEKDASDSFSKLTNQMVDLKRFAANLTDARTTLGPFKASTDPQLSNAAKTLEILYDKELSTINRLLTMIRSRNLDPDEASTIKIESSEFWKQFAEQAMRVLDLLFTDAKNEKGLRDLRITVPEHQALLHRIAADFSYSESRGAKMGVAMWSLILSGRALNHSDGGVYPSQEQADQYHERIKHGLAKQ